MNSSFKKFLKIIVTCILWAIGLFFLLCSLAFISESIVLAILMFIFALCSIPPTWRLIRKASPKVFNRKVRAGVLLGLFVWMVAITPSSTTETTKSSPKAAVAVESPKVDAAKPSKTQKQDQQQRIDKISFKDGAYKISGYGLADKTYALNFPDSDSIQAKTNSNGAFVVAIPSDTQVFGDVELSRDTNGMWFGGKEAYGKTYFALNKENTVSSASKIEPVVLGIAGADVYEVSGFYTPNKTLVLKSADAELATAKVDKSGRYAFKNIALTHNYTEASIVERVSTGWFSSKEEKLTAVRYFDKQNRSLIGELPIVVKNESVNTVLPFGSKTVESSRLPRGQSNVTQVGVSGEKTATYEVTYRGDTEVSRKVIADLVTKQPIETITTVGTYVAPAPKPIQAPVQTKQAAPSTTSSGRTGATCRDGSHSNATEKGACSHHGGVSQWLY
jgi:hypothetical protein